MFNIYFYIENLSQIQVSGIDDQFEGKKLIMNLFYWLQTFNWKENSALIDLQDKAIQMYINHIIEIKNLKL